jgi:hypothetical protein
VATRAVVPARLADRLGWPDPRAWRFDRRRDAVVLGAVAVAILLVPLRDLVNAWPSVVFYSGHDFNLYLDAAGRWLGGGPFYPPAQLERPFVDDGRAILYPPTALLLLGPLAAIPREIAAVLWIGFPVVVLVWQAIRMRPRPIVWPFLALCLAWPPTLLTLAVWNSAPVFVAFLALGTMHRWPAALILMKPSVIPFAFWGANRRSWWTMFAMLALGGIPFGAMWLDWLRVVENSAHVGGIWHSVQQFPLFLWPILVWLGRTRSTDGTIDRSTG